MYQPTHSFKARPILTYIDGFVFPFAEAQLQASKVLDEYTVNICLEDGEGLEQGTWLFSEVLEKRDIIMVW